MNNKRLTNIVLILALLVFAGVMTFTFASRAKAEGDGTVGETAVAAAIGTGFTYQGSLEDGGNPVTGSCDMQFELWESGLSGSKVGSTLTKTNVPVVGGIFTVVLDFGNQFTGEERNLHTAVRCPAGSGSYTDILGSIALTAAPYALSLRPGATIASDAAGSVTSSGAVVSVEDTYAGMLHSMALKGTSTQGVGVQGISTSGDGVHGESTSSHGVYGEVIASSGATWGVYGHSYSSGGTGVSGNAPLYGVFGEATGVLGTGYGVYGKTNAVDGYGVYSEGDAHVDGQLTWKAATSYVSVSTAAFVPDLFNDTGHVSHDNTGYQLVNQNGTDENFVAPIQLPHGAVITQLNVGWHDGSDLTGYVYLRRRPMTDVTGSAETLAVVASVGTFATIRDDVRSDDSIDYATIDNGSYTYYLLLALPGDYEVKLDGVTVKYTINQPY